MRTKRCVFCAPNALRSSAGRFTPIPSSPEETPPGDPCPFCGGTGRAAVRPQLRTLMGAEQAVILTDMVKERGLDRAPDPRKEPDQCAYLRYGGDIPRRLAEWLPAVKIGVRTTTKGVYEPHTVFYQPALELILSSLLPGANISEHYRVMSDIGRDTWKLWDPSFREPYSRRSQA